MPSAKSTSRNVSPPLVSPSRAYPSDSSSIHNSMPVNVASQVNGRCPRGGGRKPTWDWGKEETGPHHKLSSACVVFLGNLASLHFSPYFYPPPSHPINHRFVAYHGQIASRSTTNPKPCLSSTQAWKPPIYVHLSLHISHFHLLPLQTASSSYSHSPKPKKRIQIYPLYIQQGPHNPPSPAWVPHSPPLPRDCSIRGEWLHRHFWEQHRQWQWHHSGKHILQHVLVFWT